MNASRAVRVCVCTHIHMSIYCDSVRDGDGKNVGEDRGALIQDGVEHAVSRAVKYSESAAGDAWDDARVTDH